MRSLSLKLDSTMITDKMEHASNRSLIRNLLDRIGKPISHIPSAITLLRLMALPTLVFLLDSGLVIPADSIFLLAISSDLIDGYLARKLGVSSKFGANLDATVDFLFIGGIFLYYTIRGIYPAWLLMIIAAMFAQFLVTSHLTKVAFDPFGKYYGSLLYGAIGLTMLFPQQIARDMITLAFVGVSGASLCSRLIYYFKRRRRNSC